MGNIQKMYTIIAVLIVFIFSGCFSTKQEEQSLTHDSSRPLVINVLDKSMYEDCHIPGSVHVDFDKVDTYVQNISKDTEIILYCSNYACGTSEYVGKHLQSLGYKNVFAYEGGIAEWYQAGLPVVGPCKAQYLSRVMKKAQEIDEGESKTPVISMQDLAAKLNIDINK